MARKDKQMEEFKFVKGSDSRQGVVTFEEPFMIGDTEYKEFVLTRPNVERIQQWMAQYAERQEAGLSDPVPPCLDVPQEHYDLFSRLMIFEDWQKFDAEARRFLPRAFRGDQA